MLEFVAVLVALLGVSSLARDVASDELVGPSVPTLVLEGRTRFMGEEVCPCMVVRPQGTAGKVEYRPIMGTDYPSLPELAVPYWGVASGIWAKASPPQEIGTWDNLS